MAKVYLAKLIKSLERDSEFKRILRDSLQEFAPDVKLDKDKMLSVLVKQLEPYFKYPIEVPDDCIKVDAK